MKRVIEEGTWISPLREHEYEISRISLIHIPPGNLEKPRIAWWYMKKHISEPTLEIPSIFTDSMHEGLEISQYNVSEDVPAGIRFTVLVLQVWMVIRFSTEKLKGYDIVYLRTESDSARSCRIHPA